MRNLLITLTIWMICFTAITAGVVLTYNWYKDRGPVIRIAAQDAAGLAPGESKIMYRGVQVGLVTQIRLDPNYSGVIIYARMSKQVEKMLGKDSKFWIVRPEFGLDRISNLSAIATGDYIAVDPVVGEFTRDFKTLKQPPIEHPKLATGLRLELRTSALGGISEESQILYRGFQIGNVWGIDLTEDKKEVKITCYVYEEYADVIRKNSYFANISGFHANLHIFGTSKIGLDSLHTLLNGGITVITPSLSGPVAKNGDVYRILTAEQYQDMQGG